MIPRANINAWRKHAPWPESVQVEQDLILSRSLVELYRRPQIAEGLAFRGGTALHKLFFHPARRYSEDIDLVQRIAGPIGGLIAEVRAALDPWLGGPRWKQGEGRFTLTYRFESSFEPIVIAKLKIEINTREHFSVLGDSVRNFEVSNPWFSGAATISTYHLPELLGTKARALYQRKKGRDLFDLHLGLTEANVDDADLVRCLLQYMEFTGSSITRARFEANIAEKLRDPLFLADIDTFLRPGVSFDSQEGWRVLHDRVVARLPGEPWKGDNDPGKRKTPSGESGGTKES